MPPSSTGPRRARSQAVYERMRADIFAARLVPGQRLKFPDLCSRYGTSVGVAREALTRLTLERLVTAQPEQGGQGYAVIGLSIEELNDLTTARRDIEAAAIRNSVLNGTPAWEGELVAAHHMLARLDVPRAGSSDESIAEWAEAHEAFHRALFGGCTSDRLRTIAIGLREEAELYRRWALPMGSVGDRDVAAEHRAMLEAALARDADLAADLLRAHIVATSDQLLVSPSAKVSPDDRSAVGGG